MKPKNGVGQGLAVKVRDVKEGGKWWISTSAGLSLVDSDRWAETSAGIDLCRERLGIEISVR